MEIKPITIVGCGPGSLEYITPAALREIDQAEVLVGAKRLLDTFPHVKADRIVVGANVQQALDELSERFAKQRIVVLVTGDPGLCSLARPVLRRFGLSACRVLPGISSVQAAFASVGRDWLGAKILSAHDCMPAIEPAGLALEEKLALLAGNPANASWVEALVDRLLPTHEIFICENLTLADESVRQLHTQQRPMNLASRSILLFFRKESLS